MKTLTTALLLAFLLPLPANALDCPTIPAQARRDWEVEVKAAIGKIGPAKGAELETRTKTATQDLMGKLPQADKVYLEQMMYATYCSALRDDRSLSEFEKGTRIKAYNLEVRRTLFGPQGKDGRDKDKGGSLRPEEARLRLSQLSLKYAPEAFVGTAAKNDIYAAKLFLRAGMDANATDGEGNTALMYAAGNGSAPMIDALLKAKADVNQRNRQRSGVAALSWALSAGHRDAFRVLLDHGANAESINEAFVIAAETGQLEVLRILRDRGADVKKVGSLALIDTTGGLHTGARVRHSKTVEVTEEARNEVVKYLLDLGADVNARDHQGFTPLHWAATRGYVSLVRTLLDRGADIDARCPCSYYHPGSTPLMLALEQNNDDRTGVINALLARQFDVDRTNDEGQTAFMVATRGGYATREGDAITARALLEKGTDLNARDKRGRTSLMYAVRSSTLSDVVRALLERGQDMNAKDNDGWTALLWAANEGQDNNVRLLLDHGAEVNARSAKGQMTALMLAARNLHPRVVQALLERGARIDEKDVEGKTALQWAENHPPYFPEAKTATIQLLKNAEAK